MASSFFRINPQEYTLEDGYGGYYEDIFEGTVQFLLIDTLQVVCFNTWLKGEITSVEMVGTAYHFKLSFEVEENKSDDARGGTFMLYAKDRNGNGYNSEWCKLYQPISEEPSTEPTFEFTDGGEATIDLNIQSFSIPFNAEYIASVDVKESSDWLTIDRINMPYRVPNGSIQVTANANDGAERDGYIIVTPRSSFDNEIIGEYRYMVHQEGREGIITFSPSSLNIDYKPYKGFVMVDTSDIITSTLSYSFAVQSGATPPTDWLTTQTISTGDTSLQMKATIKLPMNDSTFHSVKIPRVINILVSGTSSLSGKEIRRVFTITQNKGPEVSTFPIWRDTDIEINNGGEYAEYRILDSRDSIIYQGRCYEIDGYKRVRINDIIKQYINENISFSNGIFNSYGLQEFYFQVNEDGNNFITKELLRVYNDWSYDNDVNPNLSHSIGDVVDERQYLVVSCLSLNDEKQVIVGLNTFYVENEMANIVQSVSSIEREDDGRININVDGEEKRYKVTCNNRYCLYYRNVYGGYDWLLLNDSSKQTNNITTLQYTKRSDNSKLYWRELTDYEKSITETFKLSTNLISDEDAVTLSKMMSSVDCYLQDLEEGWIKPFNITNTSVDIKSFKNNSRKPFTYTIQGRLSNSKLSR